MNVKNQLIIPAENFGKCRNLTPVQNTTMSKEMERQIKLVHKVVDILARQNRKKCLSLLRCNVENPESACAQVQIMSRISEDDKFQQFVFRNNKNGELLCLFDLLDVINSVYDNGFSNHHNCEVL